MESSTRSRSSEPARPRHRIAWGPAFLVGFSAAVAAELAAGLLLYSGTGFLRALTTVLATETAALGAGFALSQGMDASGLDGMRRRWLFVVVSFGTAAVFAVVWGLTGGFASSPVFQGLGLAMLAALPLFSAGAVLGGIASFPGPKVATPASIGATAGLILAGIYGITAVQPPSMLLLCVVLLSAGALHHGWLLDRRILVGVQDDGVEVWARESPPLRMKVVTLEGEPADARIDGVGPEAVVVPWQRQVVESVGREWPAARAPSPTVGKGPDRDRVLVAGVGLGALVEGLVHVTSEGAVQVVGPDADGGSDWVVDPESWHRGFRTVVVNARLLPRLGPLGGPDLELLDRLIACWSGEGAFYLGGVPAGDRTVVDETADWLGRRASVEPLYFRPEAGSAGGAAELLQGAGALLVCRPRDETR